MVVKYSIKFAIMYLSGIKYINVIVQTSLLFLSGIKYNNIIVQTSLPSISRMF